MGETLKLSSAGSIWADFSDCRGFLSDERKGLAAALLLLRPPDLLFPTVLRRKQVLEFLGRKLADAVFS